MTYNDIRLAGIADVALYSDGCCLNASSPRANRA